MLNAKNDDYRVLTSDFDFSAYEVQMRRGEEIASIYLAITNLFTKQIFGRIATWYKRQRLAQDLESLDDRLLADVGISREQIPAAVRNAYPYPVNTVKGAPAEVAVKAQSLVAPTAEVAAAAVNDRHPAQVAA